MEEGLYNKINRQDDDETRMSSMWRDILFIWIIFPVLLFAQFHVTLASDSEEDMPLRKLAPAILLFSATAWFYRRTIVCIENAAAADHRADEAEPLPLGVVLLPEIFVGTVLIFLASAQNVARALDVLLTSIIILSALAACIKRPHDSKSGALYYDKLTRDRSFVGQMTLSY
jgi:hypothetical protein